MSSEHVRDREGEVRLSRPNAAQAQTNAATTRHLELLRSALREARVVGSSPAMQKVYDLIELVAPTRTTVLLLGERGTGKELVARAIHLRSGRTHDVFVAVNCAAIPENLQEAEFFGIEERTATGVAGRKGYFEQAEGGTIFLDEVADMSPTVQAKLLRVLQQNVVVRVGGQMPVVLNVRVIAATNKDIYKLVEDGGFREDLLDRLNVFAIRLPPLRERTQDIPELVQHFVRAKCEEEGWPVAAVSEEAMNALVQSPPRGNVRVLRNTIERALVLEHGGCVQVSSLGLEPVERRDTSPGRESWATVSAYVHGNEPPLLAMHHQMQADLLDYFARAGRNASEAERLYGIPRKRFSQLDPQLLAAVTWTGASYVIDWSAVLDHFKQQQSMFKVPSPARQRRLRRIQHVH